MVERDAMRVVMATRSFPPQRNSASRRPWKLAKYLHREGARVTVVVHEVPDRPDAFGLSGVTLVRVEQRRPYKDNVSTRAPSSILRRFARWLAPLDSHLADGWALGRAAASLAADQNAVLWATSGPPSYLFSATVHAWMKGVPIVADLRDLWLEAPDIQAAKSRLTLWCIAWLERWVLSRARIVTVVSEAWVPLIASKTDTKCIAISNGFDPEDRPIAANSEKYPRTNLVYAGRLVSGNRNASAIRDLVAVMPKQFQLDYYGPDDVLFAELTASYPDSVAVRGTVPLPELLQAESEAGGLIAIGSTGTNWEASGALPAKIYEYMLAERPILYIGKSSHIAAERVKSLPQGFVVSPNSVKESANDSLSRFFEAVQRGSRLDSLERAKLESVYGYPELARDLFRAIQGENLHE